MNEFKYVVGQSVWTSTQMMRKIEDRRVNGGVNEYLFGGAVWVGEAALDFVKGRIEATFGARGTELGRLRIIDGLANEVKSAFNAVECAKNLECTCSGFVIQYEGGCCCEAGRAQGVASARLKAAVRALVAEKSCGVAGVAAQ